MATLIVAGCQEDPDERLVRCKALVKESQECSEWEAPEAAKQQRCAGEIEDVKRRLEETKPSRYSPLRLRLATLEEDCRGDCVSRRVDGWDEDQAFDLKVCKEFIANFRFRRP